MFSKFISTKITAAKASDLDRSLFLWAASKHLGNVSFTLSVLNGLMTQIDTFMKKKQVFFLRLASVKTSVMTCGKH